MSKLYGVGVGPGDSGLLTLKAAEVLRNADIIAVPDKGSGEKVAMNIVKEHIFDKEILYCDTPMVRDKVKLNLCYDKIAQDICNLLNMGKDVAFITLGDPTVYSTYIYIHKRVVNKGYEAEIIPGVTSFCAAAAKLGIPLCERDEKLLIIPASHNVEEVLDIKANKVFMKAGRDIEKLYKKLETRKLLEKSSLVQNYGMDGEQICPEIAKAELNEGYFSIVITKDDE